MRSSWHRRGNGGPLGWLAALLLAVLAALMAPPVAADPASPYGVNVHAPSGAHLAELFDQVQAAGIGWVRIDLVWGWVEPQPGVFDWSLYDEIVAAARARDLEVLALLAYTPGWATDGPEISGVPRDPADWADFCARAARRYRGQIRYWELWNEPNLKQFWAGSRAEYRTVILEPGADAIHAADPDARVGGPALAHLVSGSSDWYRWLSETIEKDGDRLDFLTHHIYDRDGAGDVTRKITGSTRFGSDPRFWDVVQPSLREVLKEAGWVGRPVWLTETGWASDEVGEAKQAAYTSELLETWFGGDPDHQLLAKIFLYEMEDSDVPGVPRFGLLDATGAAKPAYRSYRNFIAAHPVSSAGPGLGLLGGRYTVRVRWHDPRSGDDGVGMPIPFSDQTGFFWFFSPDNVELLVKVLDGGPVNGHTWVFYGGLSDVDYRITVSDERTGEVREYDNPAGRICGGGDTAAFPSAAASSLLSAEPLTSRAGLGVVPTLRLQGGRFLVQVAFHDQHNGSDGQGFPIPGTDETGFFWFFSPDNVELAVKVLDARPVNGHFWVFFGALSDVAYRVTVIDTQTGARRTYLNPAGTICGQADTTTF